MNRPRIEWTEGKYANHSGKVGGIHVVSVVYRTRTSDPRYVLDTPLPVGIPARLHGADTVDEAKAMAEEVVRRFLRTLGADYVDEAEVRGYSAGYDAAKGDAQDGAFG